jgi:hypothetical protein
VYIPKLNGKAFEGARADARVDADVDRAGGPIADAGDDVEVGAG